MKFLPLFASVFLFTAVYAANDYPIVLVHGFLGWDRNELLGYKYWGGLWDVQEILKSQGYTVYTAAVGPISSTWDRTTELYARIKGGQVDYGAAHSAQFAHSRRGRTFTALYPQWGTTVNGQIKKVHIIAHSQGGQDARMLVHLLKNGAPAEVSAAADVSNLFRGGKDWVASVTTIQTPHDGTSLATGIQTFVPFVKDLVAHVAGLAGILPNNLLYDFKLDQYGLTRRVGESFSSYQDRVMSSSIFRPNQKDNAMWSLSPDGAAEVNAIAKANPNVFYMTYASEATYKGLLTDKQYPDALQLVILWPFSTFMGSYIRAAAGVVRIDSSWFQNDGVVNTRSHKGPTINTNEPIVTVPSGGTLQRGVYNFVGMLSGWDHLDTVGDGERIFLPLYSSIAGMVKNLPVGAGTAVAARYVPDASPRNATYDCAQAKEVYTKMCINGTYSNSTELTFSLQDCAELAKTLSAVCNPQPTLLEVSHAVLNTVQLNILFMLIWAIVNLWN